MNKQSRKITVIFVLFIFSFLYSNNTQELLDQAAKLENEGKLIEAVTVYNKILEIEPENVKASRKIIMLERKLEKEKPHEDEEESFESLIQTADFHYSRYDYWTAEPYYSKALELEPSSLKAMVGKANCSYHSFARDEAMELFEKILTIDANNISALKTLALNFQLNYDYDKAVQYYDRLFAIEDLSSIPEIKQIYIDGAIAYSKINEFDKCHQILEKAFPLFPDDANIPFQNGIAYFDEQKYQDSVDWFEKSLEINDRDEVTWYRKGVSYQYLIMHPEANICFDKSLEINPEYVNSHYFKGVTLTVYYKDYENALLHLNKYLEIMPDNLEALFFRCSCLIQLSQFRQALDDINKMLEIDPNHESAIQWKPYVEKQLN